MKDRYRPVFCSVDFYVENQPLFLKWKHRFKNLSKIETVQAWVVGLSLLRRKKDWFGGLRKTPLVASRKTLTSHSLTFKDLIADTEIKSSTKVSGDIDLLQFINTVKIKALPESCLRSLYQITDLTYPIQVVSEIPTPQHILNYQLAGQRVISFNENIEEWPSQIYFERDFLSFMIHDLIHADHFFLNNQNQFSQLGFYRCIQQIQNHPHLLDLLKNSFFKEGFEYVISDMNSHPVHLFKTLHAKLKQTLNVNETTKVVWKNWTFIWSQNNLQVDSALQKINTQLFSDIDAMVIENFSFALGHKKPLAASESLL